MTQPNTAKASRTATVQPLHGGVPPLAKAGALALMTLAAPAMAQDAPIYAPCLEQHGNTEGYIAAMEDAGWTHRTWGMMRNRAAPAVAEIDIALLAMPNRFRNALETQAHVDRIAEMYASRMDFNEFFTRDGMSASVSNRVGEYPAQDGSLRVNCTFAGAEVPDTASIFAADTRSMDNIAVEIGTADVGLPDGSLEINVTAIRYTGPEAVLGPISGREGITIGHRFEAPE